MAAETKQNIKQLKVDNWGVFFLQRLQLLFAKGDCCDLTLRFVEGQELKVHRLVLNTCTTYFENSVGNKNFIDLPETLTYPALQPIINFMYSGRLEFRPELHPSLLLTAKVLKMDILVKLLNAQPKGDTSPTTTVKAEVKKQASPSPTVTRSLPSPSTTPTLSNMMSGKKLPIWRKRTLPLVHSRPLAEEDPRPTRFEWPGPEDSSSMMMSSPAFSSLSYESMPVLQSPVSPPSPVRENKAIKRRVVPAVPPQAEKTGEGDEQPPQDPLSDDDDDDGHFETLHNYDDSDEENLPESSVNQLKPILKANNPSTGSSDPQNSTPPSKKVRFSLENDDTPGASKTPNNSSAELQMVPENPVSVEKPGQLPNHAKIIAEVLKKFPELVKNNKNIKLKITAPPSSSSSKTTTLLIDNSTKVGIGNKVAAKASYVVMKSSLPSSDKGVSSSIISVDKGNENSKQDNVNGPWQCKSCGTSENNPMNFDSYVSYRKHLQSVHMERLGSRACEYCGFKASKRNLHLYHLYTKHNVVPPKNIKFPKCSQCSYIALTESLLIKHQISHQTARELTCNVCHTIFKTSSSLQAHSVTCKPNNEVRNYVCKHCKKLFKTNVSLNAHSKVCQEKQTGGGSRESNTDADETEAVEMIEVPVLETVGMDKGQPTLLQLPTGIILAETPNMAILPSSESDGMNNVTSGIATSIGLTVALPEDQAVILLDENSEFFLQGNNSVVVSNSHAVEEYIVPEILQDNAGHLYSTTGSLPYAVSGTNVIAYPLMHIQQSNKELHSSEIKSLVTHSVTASKQNAIAHSNRMDQLNNPSKPSLENNSRIMSPEHSNQLERIPSVDTVKTPTSSISQTSPPAGSNNLSQKQEINNTQMSESQSRTEKLKPVAENDAVQSKGVEVRKPQKSPLSPTPKTVAQPPAVSTVASSNKSISNKQAPNIISNKTGSTSSNKSISSINTEASLKAKSIEGDWDFDEEEEEAEMSDDPELKPSRPTIDLQELP